MTILRKEVTMKIEIDYDGSKARCRVTTWNETEKKLIAGNVADFDNTTLAMVLGAFHTIEMRIMKCMKEGGKE